MKNISLIFCSILIPIFTFSQWTVQSPLPQGNYLTSIRFTDANTGYVAGGGGTILKTFNAGTTWTALPSGTTKGLSSIFFVDANIGYAVGDSGTILKTVNAGATWTAQVSGTTDGLRSVYFTSANTGYAVGGAYISTTWSYTHGVLLKTINGGSTWTATTNSLSWIVSSVFFTDANTGYAVGSASTFFGGSGYMLKTIDGGSTWTESWGYGIPISVYFTDANTGYTLGSIDQQYSGPIGGYIDKTTDGGATWNQVWYQDGIYPASVCFTNATTGYAVGRSEDGWFMPTINGVILKTINSGNTWTTIFFGVNQGFSSVAFTDVNNGYVAGGGIFPLDGWSSSNDGSTFKTTNAGTSWTYLLNGAIYDLNSVCFNDANNGFAVGDGGSIVKTTTGGTTWSSMSSGTSKNLNSVDFTSGTIGYVAGEGGTILKTINSGTIWTALASGTGSDLRKIYFISASTGFIAGNNGTLRKTTNAGVNWSPLTSGTGRTLSSIFFTSTSTGYAVGDSGTIIKTTNGGTSWGALASGTTKFLRSVYFISASTGYVVGDSGTILKTVNSGSTWIALSSGTTKDLSDIYFTNTVTGYSVGASGKIFKTMNGGDTWSVMTNETSNSLTSVYFADASTGFVVGAGGTILKTGTPPLNQQLSNLWVADGETNCYNATQTITLAGNSTTFAIQSGGSATLIAGQNIRCLPGASVVQGGYLHGYITDNSSYCGTQNYSMLNKTTSSVQDFTLPGPESSFFRVYPNPFSGKFYIEYNVRETLLPAFVKVYNIFGEMVFYTRCHEAGKQEISLDGKPSGFYFVLLISGDKTVTKKVLKV